jgi:hypothetical protein
MNLLLKYYISYLTGRFHHAISLNSSSFDDRMKHSRLAVSNLDEGIMITTKKHGPLHPATLQFKSIKSIKSIKSKYDRIT